MIHIYARFSRSCASSNHCDALSAFTILSLAMGNLSSFFFSTTEKKEIIEKTKFSRQNRSAAYSSSYKDANVESSEENENRDTKYRTLTAVVDPNCAIDILSMCIM